MKKRIKALKRIFVVFLAVAMVMNTINLTGFVSHAEEGILPAVEETIQDGTEADTEGDSVPEYALTEDEYEEESLAEDAENVQASEEETFFVESVYEIVDGGTAETSAALSDFYALDGAGNVALKSGNHVNWIDRLDLEDAGYATDFYNWLVANSDPETAINSPRTAALFDPENNNTGEVSRMDANDDGINESYVYTVKVFEGSASFTYTGDQNADAAAAYAAIKDELNANKTEAFACISAVYYAFDRDEPEVFWLSGACQYMNGYSYSYNSAGTANYEQTITFVLKSDSFDIRETAYQNADVLTEAIEDTLVASGNAKDTILAGLEVGATRYEKVKYLNKWLTEHNCYHSDVNNAGNDAHECITALTGTYGTNGPVCEAYARAFKVLCDAVSIPCVLVDGTAVTDSGSGPHMWNYVQMDDGKWYGVDVTWNDPTTGTENVISGAEHENYLLVGSDTVIGSRTFIASHPVSNTVTEGGVAYINGPVLETDSYQVPSDNPVLTVAGETVDTSRDSSGTGWSYDYDTNTLTLTANVTGSILCTGDLNIGLGTAVTLTGNIEVTNGDLVIGGTGHLTISGTTATKGNIIVTGGTLTINGTGSLYVECKVTADRFAIDGAMHVIVQWGMSVTPDVTGSYRVRIAQDNTWYYENISEIDIPNYFEYVDGEHGVTVGIIARFNGFHTLTCNDSACACKMSKAREYHVPDPENHYDCKFEGCKKAAAGVVIHQEDDATTITPRYELEYVTGNSQGADSGCVNIAVPGDTIRLCHDRTASGSNYFKFNSDGNYYLDLDGYTYNAVNGLIELTESVTVTLVGSGTLKLPTWNDQFLVDDDFKGYIYTQDDKKTRIYGQIPLTANLTIPSGETYDFIDGAKYILGGYTVTENGTIQVNGVAHSHSSNVQVTYAITEEGHTATTVCVDCPVEYKTVGTEEEHNYVYSQKGETVSLDCDTCKNGRGAWGLRAPANLYYDGSVKEASVSGSITGVSAPVISYTGTGLVAGKPVDVGTYTASVEVNGISLSIDFTIKGNLEDYANVETVPNVTFNGIAQKPLPVVTLGNNTLVIDTDYTVTYENNTNAGTAYIIITGMGNYEGEKKVSFTINKAAAPAITWPAAGSLTYGQTLTDSALTGGSTTYGSFAWADEFIVPTVVNSGYKVIFTPSAHTIQNYETITVTEKIVSVAVAKAAAPVITWPTASEITYGQALSDSVLTGGSTVFGSFAWELPETMPNAGEAVYKVIFTPSEDTVANYETITPTVKEITVNVKKAAAPVITWPVAGNLTYGQTLAESLLTGGSIAYGTFAWEKSDAVPTVGNEGYKVIFTPSADTLANYEAIEITEKNVVVNVSKAAAPELTWPVADEGVYGQQLKDISFVSMETTYGTFAWEDESAMLLCGSHAYTVVFTPSAHTLQNYEAVSVTEKEITVNAEQAEIKIESITAEDKIFDKSNVVTISNIQISGVVGADDVSIDVSQLVATVSSADANTYDKVYPAGLKLAGHNKDYYKLEDVSDGISAQVIIHKAPAEILIEEGKDSYSKTFGEEEFLLEGISFTGEGALSYSVGNGKNLFGTADKDAASILKVSEEGVVTILGTGKATITVDAASSSNYEVAAPKTIEVTIHYSGIIHMDEVGEVTYTGSAIKPEINVYDGSTEVVLQKGKDYTITYKNNVNAYTLEEGEEGFDAKKAPQIIIKGKGNYSAVITAYFTIAPKDISVPEDTSILADDVLTEYNGKVQKKVPVITYNKKKLAGVAKPDDGSMPAKLKDFVYSYPDLADENAYKNAGTWEIIVEGTGNYTGSRPVNLIIAAKGGKMTAAKVKPIPAQEYNDGNPVILDATELVVTAKVNGVQTTLVEGEHFETTYKNNEKVGTASVTLTALEGSGLAGSKTVTFKIVGTSLKKAKVEGLENVTYNGKAQTLNLKVTMPDGTVLVKDRDYEVSYSKNSNAGTAKVTVKGTGAYTDSVTKSFKILAYNMSGETDAAGNLRADSLLTEVNGLLAMKNGELSVKFTKGGAMPAVELVFDGVTLQAGKDYTLAYKNNKNVYTLVEGEAGYKANKAPLITVKGKGNFTGSFTKTFVITGRGLSDSEVGVIMTADDKAASTKPGGYISKPVIKDADGKALQQGKDYTVPVYTMTGADGEDVILGAKDVVSTVGAEITVTVKGLGNYAVEEDEGLSYTYRLTAKSISSVKVTGIEVPYSSTSKAYLTRDDFYNADGTSKVTIGSGKNKEYLDFEEDFEIVPGSYQKNDKKGTATVTIKGINEYGGTKTIKFKVGTRTLGDWDWWPFR